MGMKLRFYDDGKGTLEHMRDVLKGPDGERQRMRAARLGNPIGAVSVEGNAGHRGAAMQDEASLRQRWKFVLGLEER